MNRWHAITLVLIVAALAGCTTPRARLRAAVDAYAATMETMAELRAAGHIDDEAADQIEAVRIIARTALARWAADIDRGEDPSVAISAFRRALDELIAQRLNAVLSTEAAEPDKELKNGPD